jgi:hypothetical protein
MLNFAQAHQENVLDITDLKEHGPALHTAIVNAVKDTQGTILAPLPDVLVMTALQYKELDAGMMQAYQSDDRIYMTPLNAMNVRVKDTQNLAHVGVDVVAKEV